MDSKLYKLMNWPEIESVVYSECDHPQDILGMHQYPQGTLIQAFFPGAESVLVHNFQNDSEIPMECVDEEGFFALLLSGKNSFAYEYVVDFGKGNIKRLPEIYSIMPSFWGALLEKHEAGVFYDSYRYFGAHFVERKGVLGVEFITFAPNAARVSVVGDFNNWDGRVHQMIKLSESGVFGIFIPNVSIGSLYKFEVKINNALTFLKRDPYARCLEDGPNDACRVSAEPIWEKPFYRRFERKPDFCMYNVSLRDFAKSGASVEEIAEKISETMRFFGYNILLFDDLTKCHGKIVCKDETVSFFSPDPSVISADNLEKLVVLLHEKNIPVVLSLDLSSFIPDNGGLKGFDGTGLFGADKVIDNKITFDFSNPYVRNYLISVCDYFVRTLYFDGICVGGIDRILYLDYKKNENEYRPNIYGGNDSLGGIEFIKHLNSIMHKRYPDIYMFATDSYASNVLTTPIEDGGLGFDYKLHGHFDGDVVSYLENDPFFRTFYHSELTYSPVYIYCEKFVLALLRKKYGCNEAELIRRLPGELDEKYANLKLLLAYFFVHPGRKCLPFTEFAKDDLRHYLKALIKLYNDFDNIFANDDKDDSFEWINAIDSEKSVISFIRKEDNKSLLVVANFSNDKLEKYDVGVPEGKYREIFASASTEFGGGYSFTKRWKSTKHKKADGRGDSLTLNISPLCLHIYEKDSCNNL